MTATYSSPELVQSELRLTTPFTSNTIPSLQSVNRWILEASADVDHIAKFEASETSRTEMVDYTGAEYINVKHSPIVAVTSLLYNTNDLGSDLGEAWVAKTEGTDYFVDTDAGQILINFRRWNPVADRRKIKILYTSGYVITPFTHQELTTKIVADRILSSLLNSNINDGNDGGSVSVGSISIVEPSSYGVNNYKRLQTDIQSLKEELVKGTGVYRYTAG